MYYHLISARKSGKELIVQKQKKKKSKLSHLVDFAVPEKYKMKSKESENKDKYLRHTLELKDTWNTKVRVIPFFFGTVRTIFKKDINKREN